MIVLRANELVPTPWKNDAGTTAEYAIHPPNATLHAFDWRISRARVAKNGPFSCFPGIERTLSVLSGAGLILEFNDRSVRLTPNDPPFTFSGDLPVNGRLIGGAIEDLNVMTRRSRWQQSVKRLTQPMITEPDATAWLFALEPLCVLDPPLQLDQFDAAILPGGVSIAACPALLAQLSPSAPRTG